MENFSDTPVSDSASPRGAISGRSLRGALALSNRLMSVVVGCTLAIAGLGAFVAPASAAVTGATFDDGIRTWTFNSSVSGEASITECVTTSGGGVCSGAVVIPSTVVDGLDSYVVTALANVSGDGVNHPFGLARSTVTSVVIPNTVRSVGNYFFYLASAMASVSIGTGVTSIGSYAFSGDTSLTSVAIPDNVTALADGTFSGDTALASVTLSSALLTIPSNAFRGTGLLSVVVPNSVQSIGFNAFLSAAQLATVTLGSGVTSIGEEAFESTAITSINIPANVLTIEDYAFYDTRFLASVTLHTGLQSIGMDAFDSANISSIEIPASVTSIGTYAFYNTPLSSVTLHAGLQIIGEGAFYDTPNLHSIIIPSSVTTIGAFLFGSDVTPKPMNYPMTSITFLGNAPATVFSVGSPAQVATDLFFDSYVAAATRPDIDPLTTVVIVPGRTGWPTPPATYAGINTAFIAEPFTSIAPLSASGSGGTTVTITGHGFVTGTTVNIGSAACTSVAVLSPSSLTCVTPVGRQGNVNVVVSIPDYPSSTGTSAFTYTSTGGGSVVTPVVDPVGVPVVVPIATPSVSATPSASASPVAIVAPVVVPVVKPVVTTSASPSVVVPSGVVLLKATELSKAVPVVVTAPVATSPDNAPVVTVEVGAPVAPLVRGLPGRTRMSVGMSAATLTRAKTTYASLGSTTSDAAGSAKVPAFKASRAGVYTIQLATAQGKAFYLKINVAAKKASKSVTNKVVANK